jgi:hypothetical protein
MTLKYGNNNNIVLNNNGTSTFLNSLQFQSNSVNNILLNANGTSNFLGIMYFQTRTVNPLTSVITTNNNITLNPSGLITCNQLSMTSTQTDINSNIVSVNKIVLTPNK